MNLRLLSKILALLVLVTLGTYLFTHYNWYVYFVDRDKAIQLITSFHPYDEVFLILLQIIQVVAAPIPGEATGLIGGYLYGPYLGTLYSTIGLTIGSWIAFILARFFGMPLGGESCKSKELSGNSISSWNTRGRLYPFCSF